MQTPLLPDQPPVVGSDPNYRFEVSRQNSQAASQLDQSVDVMSAQPPTKLPPPSQMYQPPQQYQAPQQQQQQQYQLPPPQQQQQQQYQLPPPQQQQQQPKLPFGGGGSGYPGAGGGGAPQRRSAPGELPGWVSAISAAGTSKASELTTDVAEVITDVAPSGSFMIQQESLKEVMFPFGPDMAQKFVQTINSAGEQVADTVAREMTVAASGLSYDQMIEGFLFPGELVDTSVLPMEYDCVKILDFGCPDVKETLPPGQAVLTNKRILMTSCQPNEECTFETVGQPRGSQVEGHYKLSYSANNAVSFSSIALNNFRSFSMQIESSSRAEATVSQPYGCYHAIATKCPFLLPVVSFTCGVCNPFCGLNWQSSGPASSQVNSRYMTFDYEGAWGKASKKVLHIDLSEKRTIVDIQKWATQVVAKCPKIMDGNDAPAVTEVTTATAIDRDS
jgi:hypothetical protein